MINQSRPCAAQSASGEGRGFLRRETSDGAREILSPSVTPLPSEIFLSESLSQISCLHLTNLILI